MTDHYKDAPGDYKHPSDRTSILERPVPAHDTPVAPVDPAWPKHVHKAAGKFLEVGDQAALDAAKADGWLDDPPVAEAEPVDPPVAVAAPDPPKPARKRKPKP